MKIILLPLTFTFSLHKLVVNELLDLTNPSNLCVLAKPGIRPITISNGIPQLYGTFLERPSLLIFYDIFVIDRKKGLNIFFIDRKNF